MSNKSVMAFQANSEVPAFLREQGSNLGNENVGAGDMQVPRIDLIQMLSPQVQKNNAKFIEGAEVGKMFNTLDGALYDFVFLVNLYYDVTYSVFKKRKLGGGMFGFFDSEAAALAALEAAGQPADQYDIMETAIHTCLMLDENGIPKQPVRIYMSGSKMKVSNNWNTQIALKGQGADRFATVWTLTSVEETNKQNQPYQNFHVEFAGFVGEDLYAEAKKNYLALRNVVTGDADETTH